MEYIRGRQNPETQADHYELRRRINSLNLGGSKAKMNSSSNATRPPRQVCAVSVSKGPFILLCQIISLECTTNFEFGATFSIVASALKWFWFEFDLFYLYANRWHWISVSKTTPSYDLISKLRDQTRTFEVTTDQRAFKICWAFYQNYLTKQN